MLGSIMTAPQGTLAGIFRYTPVSFYVPESMYSFYMSNASWYAVRSRFVSLTTEEINVFFN